MISGRGYYILFCLGVALLISYNYGMLLKMSPDAMSALIGVFSIMAGVLVAVISIVGDPSMLLPGNWRVGHEHAKDMQVKIGNYSNLFLIYIISLILLVACYIIKDNKLISFDIVFAITTFFSLFGLMLSIPLPFGLMSIQKERMDEEIKYRRHKANRNNDNGLRK
jgi:hypothetical protein